MLAFNVSMHSATIRVDSQSRPLTSIFSFTGFINRMRGYHSVNNGEEGSEKGLLPKSYYYVQKQRKLAMHRYAYLQGAIYSREFPTSWRGLDKSVGNLPMFD